MLCNLREHYTISYCKLITGSAALKKIIISFFALLFFKSVRTIVPKLIPSRMRSWFRYIWVILPNCWITARLKWRRTRVIPHLYSLCSRVQCNLTVVLSTNSFILRVTSTRNLSLRTRACFALTLTYYCRTLLRRTLNSAHFDRDRISFWRLPASICLRRSITLAFWSSFT